MEVGTWNAIGYLAQAIGLETTHASTSAFICSLAVVIVPILDFLAGKKRLRREVIGAILAVTGVALLEFDGVEQGINVANNGMWLCPGDLYSLVQPLAFGMGFWRMEHYMRKFPNGAMKLTAAQLSMISILSLVALVFTSGIEMDIRNISFVIDWVKDPVVAGSLLWTGLVTTALTVAMETMALKTLSAAETTMLFSTEPIFGGLCASFVLGEQFGVGGLIGSAMVLSGCLYSNLDLGRGEKKRK
jgi:drug/metabolite transporter (DMT)-like permease